MAGTGTGSPLSFRCSREAAGLHGKGYGFELTGRTRPTRARRHSSLGSRSTLTDREYRCECGHVGWSNHEDLARMAARA